MLARIIPVLIFWGIFAIVVLQIPYPQTITQADSAQVTLFFLPLLLSLSFTINLLLKNILSSGSISLGLIFLLILKALDSLNLVTGVLIIIATYLLISYFRKAKKNNWEIRGIRRIRGIRVKTRNRV